MNMVQPDWNAGCAERCLSGVGRAGRNSTAERQHGRRPSTPYDDRPLFYPSPDPDPKAPVLWLLVALAGMLLVALAGLVAHALRWA